MRTPTQQLLISFFLFCPLPTWAQSLAPLQQNITRTWIGPEYFTNPLMNWRLSDGRIENTHGGWVNEVHSLTHQLKEGDGTFSMRVRLGHMESRAGSP